ncbi:MAG TPA: SDR family oxidoreductase [Rhodanobacteraceae bacterium]
MIMQDKRVALITGANQGIGLQIAKSLAENGLTVLVGSRNFENGAQAAKSIGGDSRAIQLDVTDQASIDAAADRIRKELGRLDVLVNNAGIATAKPGLPLAEVVKSGRASVASLDEVRAVFATNVFGVIAVTQAMLPLLRASVAGRIVNVSSGRASLTLASDPNESRRREMFGITYAASKVALNAVTVAFALDLASSGIKVNAAAPGFTVTAMNNFEGRRSAEEAAREPVRLALLGADGPTGTFSDDNGPIPW